LALDLESSVFQSGIIALGQVATCEPLTDNGWGYHIEVECWWMGWKDHQVQREIADFIIKALAASKAKEGGEK
jgi:hypothetical protein